MKIWKDGELVGPMIEGFFKTSVSMEKDGTLTYVIEGFKSGEVWSVSFSVADQKRMRDAWALNNHRKPSRHESSEEAHAREELLGALSRLDELKRETEGSD